MQTSFRNALSLTLMLLLCLLLEPSPVSAQAGKPLNFQPLLTEAKLALEKRSPSQLNSFAKESAESRFAWFKDTASTKWDLDVFSVKMPTSPTLRYFLTFSKWQTCEAEGDHIYPVYEQNGKPLVGEEIKETDTLGFRVTDHQVKVFPEPEKQFIRLHDRFTLERTSITRNEFCILRISPDFNIKTMTSNGKTLLSFRSGGFIILFPPEEQKAKIDVEYSGKVSHRGSDFIMPEELTLNSYWLPHIARLPVTLTLTTTPPLGWQAMTHGEIISRAKNTDGTWTVTFQNKIPHSILTLDMGKYIVHTKRMQGVNVYLYLRKARAEKQVQELLQETSDSLHWFSTNFAPYPYSRYSVVESAGPFGGALEGYSFATFASGALGAITHEVAHTWWGGMLNCTYTKAMWNESFASFSDNLFRSIKNPPMNRGADTLFASRKRMKDAYSKVPVSQGYSTDSNSHSSVGYGKGSLVLGVLNAELGRATLLRACQTFLKNHALGDVVEWEDFEKVVNQVTGKDYRWFFSQWTERTGLPQPRLESVQAIQEGGNIVVTGSVVQDPKSVYRLRLPLYLEAEAGNSTETIDVTGERTPFRIVAKGNPKLLIVDPKGIIPLAITGDKDVLSHLFGEK